MDLYTTSTFDERACIKDVDARKGIVTGYFSNFNNVDADGDILRPGAFLKSIHESGPDSSKPRIKHLYNHDTDRPLGKIEVLKEDSKGLYYESKVGTHALGIDFIKMVESGLITEHSIGFKTIRRNKVDNKSYEITEAKLWEGSSLSAWGANEETPLTGLKGLSTEDFIKKLLDKSKRLEAFCKNSDATDECIQLLLIEQKQLTQHIINLHSTLPPKGTEPQLNGADVLKAISNFTNSLNKQ